MTDEYHLRILYTEEEIEKIINELQGRKFDPETKTYAIFEKERLINDKGARAISAYLKSVLSPNSLLSVLTEEQAYAHGYNATIWFLENLFTNQEEWGIKTSNISFIINLISNYIFFALMRAVNGNEKKFHETTYKSSIVISQNEKLPIVE